MLHTDLFPQQHKDNKMSIRLHKGLYIREDTSEHTLPSEILRSYGWLNIENKSVLDVGANIGAFTQYAIRNGAAIVWAFEPEEDNFALLQKNAPTAQLYRAALVSNPNIKSIQFYKTTSGKNPGNYSCVPFRGRTKITVPAVNFQKILDKLQPEILKMDCEGAEYDLMRCKLPDSVQELAIELHLNKKEFKRLAPKLIACFDTWETIVKPKYNDKSWHCVFGVRKKQNSIIKTIGNIPWFY